MTQVPQQSARTALEAARDYFAAWNAHDGASVARLVTGTYVDPTLPAPVRGDELAANVEGLFAAFPDLTFVHEGEAVDGDTVVARWRMQGTNSGAPLPGAPAPTNTSVDLPGVDVITTKDGAVVDVVGYFDQKTFVEQLGLQAIVMPKDEWPVAFGIATRVDLDNTTVPGAVSFTWIESDDVSEIQKRTQDIITALASDPAFIGFRAASVAGRHLTLTLWTSPEAAEAALSRNGPHNEAMSRMWESGLGTAGFTSIWQPYRVNAQFRSCPECGRYIPISAGDASATCECGGTVQVRSYL